MINNRANQDDRNAAAAYMRLVGSTRWSADGIEAGTADNCSIVRTHTQHRLFSEQGIFEGLKALPAEVLEEAFNMLESRFIKHPTDIQLIVSRVVETIEKVRN